MTALPAHPARLPRREHSRVPVEAIHPVQIAADAVEAELMLEEARLFLENGVDINYFNYSFSIVLKSSYF